MRGADKRGRGRRALVGTVSSTDDKVRRRIVRCSKCGVTEARDRLLAVDMGATTVGMHPVCYRAWIRSGAA